MNTYLVIIVVLTASLYKVHGCGTNNVQCLTDSTYQFCFIIGTQTVLVNGEMSCPTGTACSENGTYVCMDSTSTDSTSTTSTSTDSTTTTTVATGPPETCTETGKYPADACDQYWECLVVMWWYELVLQTCGTDLSYNATSQECVANGTCATTSTTTESTTITTTVTPATGPPENCTEAGKYPADACDQYWECVAVLWWFELVLQSCGTDLSYNTTSQECVANGTCASTTTITESTTVTTTVTPATGPPENCTETGKYPADACDQYWECVAVLWWFELVLQSCGTDLSYNTTSQECVANGTCASTTTTTESTTVTTTVTPATGPPETCTESGTYPAEACNQYWECLLVMTWYELLLQTCGTDQAYNSTAQACVANSTCIV